MDKAYLVFFRLFVFVVSILVFSHTTDAQIIIKNEKKNIEISNEFVKAKLFSDHGKIRQQYFAKDKNGWRLIVASFLSPVVYPPNAEQLFNTRLDEAHRFLIADIVQDIYIIKQEKNEVVIKLSSKTNNNSFAQYISLKKDDNHFHFVVEATLTGKPVQIDYLLSGFTFNLDKAPEFVHTPGLKYDNEDSKQNRFNLLPGRDQIIGDRAFHSPAIILQDKKIFAALVPDLNAINKYAIISPDARRTSDIARNMFSVPIVEDRYTMPTGLDLNLKTGLTGNPVFTFGFMDNIISHHMHYQRTNDGKMIRTLASNKLRFEFDLFVSASAKRNGGFQKITAFQWDKYGHEVFVLHPHLAMPFEEYFRIVDSITLHPSKYKDIDIPLKGYEDHGSWLEFEMNGLPVGGYRSAINWWNDVMHNSTFWNNARDASGFWFWGKQSGKPDMTDKAKRIINFCLQAPQNKDGLFATLYNANTKEWGLQFSDPQHGKNQFFLRQSDSYDIPAMSKTGAHLLDYYSRCEKDERIVAYLKPYANWLVRAIDARGAVPSYVSVTLEVAPQLMYSAQPAASMWFLASMYNVTKDMKYRIAAEKIATFLEKEILPEQKWVDMEQYYSCGAKPLTFDRDVWQHQVARGNLTTIWASEGFAQLYTATGNKKYLQEGETCIDYLCFSQCSWNPHYIYTAFPFGGFTADNSDNATYLDARQAETVKPFIWYGKTLGRQDLLERGVAAARASVVLLNLPEHKANGIYEYTNIYPYGLGPENIDHEGHPQSAMRTSPSWGEGSGIFTGLAEAYRELGGGYIDFKKALSVGVNGIVINKAMVKGDTVFLNIENELAGLKMPWQQTYNVQLQLKGLQRKRYIIDLNSNISGMKFNNKNDSIFIQVFPDGKVTLRR